MRRIAFISFLYTLTAIVAFIAIRIECLNAASGGRLPSHQYRDNDPTQGCVTWRGAIWTNEYWWRRTIGPKDENSNPVVRTLTLVEQQRMADDIHAAQLNNTLREFVESAGLLQYLLVPTLAASAIMQLKSKRPSLGVIPLLTAVSAGFLMFYRAYFTSLG